MNKKRLLNNKYVLAAGGVGIILFVIWFFVLRGAPEIQAVPLATVGLSEFEVNVHAVGELDSEKSITISSGLREEGKIVYLIDDGSPVEAEDDLVRLDPTPFEQKVSELTSQVNEWNALVASQQQSLEWEKIQAEREVQSAQFDNQVAVLELQKLEKGDGPLEISRLEGAMLDAKKKYNDLNGYIKDLVELERKGYSNPLEIAQAKERVDKLKEGYEVATQQYESYKDYILPTLVKTARAKVEKTKMIIEQTKKGSGFKIGMALAELNKGKQEYQTLKRMLQDAQAELEKTVIKAPQKGLVVLKEAYRDGEMRKPRIGDTVIQNQPVLFLPDISSMMAKVLIREVDLHKIDIGKAVEVRVDAYPDLSFNGEVSFVGILAERRQEVRGGEKYFKVNISIDEPDSRLRPGMTARVRILAQEKIEKTIAVPIHAVFQVEDRRFCFIARPGGYEMREVSTGAQNEEFVQVLDGLRKGEKVCLSRPPQRMVRSTRYLEMIQKAT